MQLGRELEATVTARIIDMAEACRLFLTNDSGSMHIASALGVPTAVAFGPTDENATDVEVGAVSPGSGRKI